MNIRTWLAAGGLLAVTGAAAQGSAAAPDPLLAYPENYSVLLENEQVRVLDFRLKKGATEQFHRHPANVAVFLETFKIRFKFPDGRTGMRDARPGDVAYSGPVVHASENVGATDAHGILVELKQAATSPPVPEGAVTVITRVHGIPGKEDDLKAHLLSLAPPTRAERGCIIYDLYQSPDQKHEFTRIEVWATPADFEAHRKSPHLRASLEKRQREGWTTEIVKWDRVAE